MVGARGFEPPTPWSRTSKPKIPKPSSWRHLRDLGRPKSPLKFTTIRNRQHSVAPEPKKRHKQNEIGCGGTI
jgi:hypothetical protein